MKAKGNALIVATVASTIDQFCMNDISLLLENYDVQIAANFRTGNNSLDERITEFKHELGARNITINEIEFDRNPLARNNIQAYKNIKSLLHQTDFDLIHCHTPVAAMLTRLAAQPFRKKGTKVIYTAHGFHFYKGAPLRNWILYYPIERCLARHTDIVITINNEDYKRAKSKLKAKRIEYLPGIGIDFGKFNKVEVDKELKCDELGLPKDAFVVLTVGELNKNKNHETVIKALAEINEKNTHYVICGKGAQESHLRNLSKGMGLEDRIHFIGFRNDISQINKVSDLFVFPSYREGLSVALMEAMASGLPVVCSKIRGNFDLIEDGIGGILADARNVEQFASAITYMIDNPGFRRSAGEMNCLKSKQYAVENVTKVMQTVYGEFGND